MSFFTELKRRNVFRVGAAYMVLGWVLAQVAEFAFETFGAPDWALKAVVIVLLLGLPLALFFAWAFEMTPEGIKRDEDVDRSRSRTTPGGRRMDRAIIAVLVVALAWFAWDRFMPGEDSHPASTSNVTHGESAEQSADVSSPVTEKSVAVLPFVAMSSGPDDGYFADGLTEEILNSLARLPELKVTARTSAFSFKGRDLPVQEIAETLKVQHIVEGSVRRSANRLRVTAQLVRADDGFQLWSETYDRDAGDTFAIQTDIAEKIATALDVVLDDERRQIMARSNVRDPEAFVAFQKGIDLHQRAHGSLPQLPTLAEANRYFERAIELEPGFYDAYVAHTDLYTHTLTDYAAGNQEVAELDEEALADARRALEKDLDAAIRSAPDRARRVNTEYDRAMLLGNWLGLASLVDSVLDNNDDCATPDWNQLTSSAFGRAAETLRDFESVMECDPLLNRNRLHQAMASIWLKDFDRAIGHSEVEDGEEVNTALPDAHVVSLLAAGRIDEAEEFIETRLRDNTDLQAGLASLAAFRGEADESARIASAIAQSPDHSSREQVTLAARRGDREAANELAAFIDTRPFGYIPLLQIIYFCVCGAPFDLEATPVFAEMLEESRLPWPPEDVVGWPLKDW